MSTINGGTGNDTLSGTSGADTIFGGGGDDSLHGNGGDDVIFAGSGNDSVHGGTGHDTIFGEAGNDTLNGQDGNDVIYAGTGNDLVFGGNNNDTLSGGSGTDTLFGADGDDVIWGGWQPTYVKQTNTAGSQTFAGSNGASSFTGTVTSDETLNTATAGALDGYRIGNDDSNETHTHTFSREVAGGQIRFNAVGSNETFTLVLDGVTIDLRQAVANGDVRFNGASGLFVLDSQGRITGTSTDPAVTTGSVGSITILRPFTTVGIVASGTNTGFTAGFAYEMYVDTNPPATSDGNEIYGGTGSDTLYGDAGNDTIDVEFGNNLIHGGGGDDSIWAAVGMDTVYGGDGNDTIDVWDGNDLVYGGRGDDSILGGLGLDTLYGGDGNDIIFGGADNDLIFGGTGNDTLHGDGGNDTIVFGTGDNVVYGGDGDDFIDDHLGGFETGNNLIYGGAGNDTIWYGEGQDTVYGGTGNDLIQDHGVITTGANLLYGDAGSDTIRGGAADDTIYGGDDGDWLEGGAGNDLLFGGNGHDTIFGGDGDDTIGSIDDEGGDDLFYGGAGNDSINGGAGNDTLYGGTGDDILVGGAGKDTLFGGDDADAFVFTEDHGTSLVYGGEGGTDFDVLYFYNWLSTTGVSVTFTGDEQGTFAYSGGGATGTFFEIEGISGTDFADTVDAGSNAQSVEVWANKGNDSVIGGSGHDVLYGGEGDDTLRGGAGNDLLFGGDDNDRLFGDGGDDTLYGGAGNDTLEGGDGNDLIFGDDGNDSIDGNDGNDTLYGGAGDDTIEAGSGNDLVFGGDGDDYINGRDGDDTLYGDAGNDTIEGGAGADLVHGGDGNDLVFGGADNDTLFGGDGNDTLSGGGGDDLLYGGAGNDVVFGGDGADTIFGGVDADTLYGGTGADSIVGGDGGDLIRGDVIDGSVPLRPSGDGDATSVVFVNNSNETVDLYWINWDGDPEFYETLAPGAETDYSTWTDHHWALRDPISGDWVAFYEGGEGLTHTYTGGGDDTLSGGAGNDTIYGDGGDDTLEGGAGNDLLFGGAGDDLFLFFNGFGNDTIGDFDMADTSGDGRTNDQVDVSGYMVDDSAGPRPLRWSDLVLSQDGDGNAIVTFPDGETITFQGVAPTALDTQPEGFAAGLPCFARGTPILTPDGRRPVEEIAVGDLVITRDLGPQPVLWAGHRALGPRDFALRPDFRPIRLAPGYWGDRALMLSPQHAVLVEGVLMRSRHLAEAGHGARVMKGKRRVIYHHILLPRHGLVRAAGVWVESLYPGPEALRALAADQRRAIACIITGDPAAVAQTIADTYGPRVRPLLPRPGSIATAHPERGPTIDRPAQFRGRPRDPRGFPLPLT